MPTNNSINTPKPIDVPNGGTGLSTATTAYGVLAAGTTATGAFQNIGTGASGEVLTSNGAGALPTFQAAGGGGGDVVLLSSQNLVGVNSVTFNSFVNNTVYLGYQLKLYGISNSEFCAMQISTDNGATFLSTGYDTSSGQFNPVSGFFNWVSAQNATYSTLGFFSTDVSQAVLELIPFGESSATRVMGMSTFYQSVYPGLVWASFLHATTNANAFRIFTPVGSNWTVGRAALYGYKK